MRGALVLLAAVAACHDDATATDASVAALVTPAPRRPPHGAMLPRGPITLSWDTTPAAHTELEMTDVAGAQPTLDRTIDAASSWRGLVPPGRWRWRVRACDAIACSPWSRPRRFDVGRAPSDVDGDGYSDVIAGAPLRDGGAGAALIVFGGPDGPARTQRIEVPGGGQDAELGSAVAIVGDVDGDGFADVVVGAPGSDDQRGRAYLYLGGPDGARGPVLAIDDPAGRPGDWLGASVSAIGDVDGDGLADLAIGAPGADGDGVDQVDVGKVLVWSGSAAGLDATPTTLIAGAPRPHDGFGSALSGGDLDGDGYSDLVVGAAGVDRAGAKIGVDRGAVYVFRGGRDGIATSAIARLEAPNPADHDRFGFAVSASGDLDDDGLADLAVGAPSRDIAAVGSPRAPGAPRGQLPPGPSDDAGLDAGAIYVFAGTRGGIATTPREVLGGAAARYRRLGTSVAIVGDVDGDGVDDLAAGSSDPGGGIAIVLAGRALTGAPIAQLALAAPDPTDFGDSIAGAGDVDGDGRADVVVGAAIARGARGNGGSVLVYRAIASAQPPPPARIDGPAEAAQLGRTVAGR